jgi:hypothetical protein
MKVFVSAVETDLIEKPGKALALAPSGLEVTVPAGPYEIKTIAVKFRRGMGFSPCKAD